MYILHPGMRVYRPQSWCMVLSTSKVYCHGDTHESGHFLPCLRLIAGVPNSATLTLLAAPDLSNLFSLGPCGSRADSNPPVQANQEKIVRLSLGPFSQPAIRLSRFYTSLQHTDTQHLRSRSSQAHRHTPVPDCDSRSTHPVP